MNKLIKGKILLLFLFGCSGTYSQTIPTYPIPSNNILVNGYANFHDNIRNSKTNPTKAKMEVNVKVQNVSGSSNCQATVWIYSLDHTTVLGPYTVLCGQTLTVPIDEREWGVLVESEENVVVDVWKTISDQMNLHGSILHPQHIDINFEQEICELGKGYLAIM